MIRSLIAGSVAGLFVFGALQGCTSASTRSITWIEVGTQEETTKECAKRGGADNAVACSTFLLAEKTCTIYTRAIPDKAGPLTQANWEREIGHEVRHCFYGKFHPEGKNAK